MNKVIRYFASRSLIVAIGLSAAVESSAQTVYNFVERTPGGGSTLGGWITYFQNDGQGFIGNYSVSGYYGSAFIHPRISFSESGGAVGNAYWRSTLYSQTIHEVGFTFDRTAIARNAFWVNVSTGYSRLTGCISWPGPCGSWTDYGQNLLLQRQIESTAAQLSNRLLEAGGSASNGAALARSLKGYGDARALWVAAHECAADINCDGDFEQWRAEGAAKTLRYGTDLAQVGSMIVGSTWNARVGSLPALADNVIYANSALSVYVPVADFISGLKSNVGTSIDFFREFMSNSSGTGGRASANALQRANAVGASFSELANLDDLDLTFQRDLNMQGGWDYISGSLRFKGSASAFAGLKVGDKLLDSPISGSDAASFGAFTVDSLETLEDGNVAVALGWTHAEMAVAVPNPASSLLMAAGLAFLSLRLKKRKY